MPPQGNPQPTPPQNPAPEKPVEKTNLKQIRTFQGDVANALKNQNESLVSIQRAEQVKRRATPIDIEGEANRRKGRKSAFLLFLGTIFLVVLGVVGAWYVYNEFVVQTSPPEIEAPANRFFFADNTGTILVATTTRQELINTLVASLTGTGDEEIKHVVLRESVGETTQLLSTEDFLDKLDVRAPGSLVRAFGELFMLGNYGESVFLILDIESFENTYAGMLLWEDSVAEDVGPIFSTSLLLRGVEDSDSFRDVVVRNKDVRTLSVLVPPVTEGATGTIEDVLMYSFFDNEKLIITDNAETLQTIIERLTREKLSR